MDTNEKIEQCKRDIETLQENLRGLEGQKREETWIVRKCLFDLGISGMHEFRIILHLSALSYWSKQKLVELLRNDSAWVIFNRTGVITASSKTQRLDKYYTDIVTIL